MRKHLAAAALSACLGAPATAGNVLLVLADDMGVDSSPCHVEGSSTVRMPTLKALCDQGMVFENAHAAPVCSPTRAMILTGKYASKTGVGSASKPLSDSEKSLFDVLNKSAPNVASAVIGKWHLGMDWAGGMRGEKGYSMRNNPEGKISRNPLRTPPS